MTVAPLDPAAIITIRKRSDMGSADWDDPITDARALLTEVDRLAAELAAALEREKMALAILMDRSRKAYPGTGELRLVNRLRAALGGEGA